MAPAVCGAGHLQHVTPGREPVSAMPTCRYRGDNLRCHQRTVGAVRTRHQLVVAPRSYRLLRHCRHPPFAEGDRHPLTLHLMQVRSIHPV
jgi:hypothetical protein